MIWRDQLFQVFVISLTTKGFFQDPFVFYAQRNILLHQWPRHLILQQRRSKIFLWMRLWLAKSTSHGGTYRLHSQEIEFRRDLTQVNWHWVDRVQLMAQWRHIEHHTNKQSQNICIYQANLTVELKICFWYSSKSFNWSVLKAWSCLQDINRIWYSVKYLIWSPVIADTTCGLRPLKANGLITPNATGDSSRSWSELMADTVSLGKYIVWFSLNNLKSAAAIKGTWSTRSPSNAEKCKDRMVSALNTGPWTARWSLFLRSAIFNHVTEDKSWEIVSHSVMKGTCEGMNDLNSVIFATLVIVKSEVIRQTVPAANSSEYREVCSTVKIFTMSSLCMLTMIFNTLARTPVKPL